MRSLFPGAGVALAATAFLLAERFGLWWVEIGDVERFARTYGLAVYGAGLAFAWIFHRSRAFAALAILAWVDVAEDRAAVAAGSGTAELPAAAVEPLIQFGTVLLALLGILAVMRDRGVWSRVGVLQIVGVSLGAAFAAFLVTRPRELAPLTDSIAFEATVWPGYPRVTLIVAALAMAGVAYGLFRYRGPVERSFAWCSLMLMVAMHHDATSSVQAIFLMATGLTITLGIVETSYVMAYRDELTGLPGRRALMHYLDEIQGTYTVAMVDVDHFKKFNDKHGHDVGDQVLKLVAAHLAKAPGGGKAYRYGGEEFTLLYPGRTRQDALPHLESVRGSVEEARFSVRSWKRPRKKPSSPGGKKPGRKRKPRTLSVTVSIGMADSTAKDSAPSAVLKRADIALYRAKKNGRNQVSK